MRVVGCALVVGLFLGASAHAAPPRIEVLGFGGRGDTDSTRLWALSSDREPREIGRVHHRPGSSVKGALLPDRRVVAVAERREARERSWTGALYLVDGAQTTPLLDDVYEGSWPVALDARRVLVARGEAGPTLPTEQRIDRVFVDQLDLTTRKVKRLYQSLGYLAFPIGEQCGVIYVADYGPAGVSLVAIDRELHTRVVASDLLLARDFSLDAGRNVVYAQVRHPSNVDRWLVVEIDLATGARRELVEGAHYALMPHRWPGADLLAFNATPARGLHLLRLADRRAFAIAPVALPGVDEVTAMTNDGRAAVVKHHLPNGVATSLWLVDTKSTRATKLELPQKELRFEVVGVVDAAVQP